MTPAIRRGGTAFLAALLIAALFPAAVLGAAPDAVDDPTNPVVEDVTTPLDVLANDTDLDVGDTLTVTAATDGSKGVVTITNGGADLSYNPDANATGSDSFTYTISDGTDTDSATVTVQISATNDPPVANPDPTNPIVEDVTTTLDPLANDTDPDNDSLTITGTSAVTLGVVTITNGGTRLSYNPTANATGSDSFTYTISDGTDTDSATVTVQISATNDPPVANPDPTNPIVEDVTTTLDPLANDTDPDNDSLTITGTSAVTLGVVTITNGGTRLSYNPTANATGNDSFTYTISDGTDTDSATVTVQISATNDPPVANPDPTNPIVEDVTTTLDPLANDTDPDNDSLTITGTSAVTLGVVTITNGGTRLSYNPTANATGNDSFTYTISDGTDTDSATVTVQISATNDPPVANPDPTNPIVEDVTTTLDPLANDTDPDNDSLTITGTSAVTLGVVTITNGGTRLSYNPTANATGSDSFTYTISDGTDTDSATVTVQISATNDPPVANPDTHIVGEDSGPAAVSVLGNDTDPDAGDTRTVISKTNPSNGTLSLVSGVLTYTPAPNDSGSDSFTYTISDGGLTDTATVSITVTAVNDPPVAVDDVKTVGEDSGPSTVSVLGNDSDIDGPSETVTSKTDPTHGTLSLVAGILTYTPAANYFGPDSFDYTMSDGTLTSGATVSITVSSVNDDPDAADESVTVARDTGPNPVNVLLNDSDVEPGALLITGKTNGAKGTVVITGGGTGLTYDPFTGYSGADSFTYTISDGNGGTDLGTVSVTIAGANRAPNAANDVTFSVPEGAAATTLDVVANDDDPDGDTFTITARTNPAHGSVVIAEDGLSLTYDPVSLYHGTDTFTYTIRDAGGLSDTATVVVTVTEDTSAPIVVAPAQRLPGQTVGSTTLKARLAWSATDAGSGIKKYDLQVSVNGGTFGTLALASATSTTIDRILTESVTYRYRVRATDKEGNVSAWRYSPTFKPNRWQETTTLATYSGTWAVSKLSGALGGSAKFSSSATAAVSFTVTAYDIALVVTKTSASGDVDIYIDNIFAASMDLRASSPTFRQLIFTRHFTTSGPHTIRVEPVGNGRVDVDAFAVLR